MIATTELTALQNQIAVSKKRADRLMRNLWGVIALLAFICFGGLFFLPSLSEGINNLPFVIIGVFGVITIAVLISGDVLFFNKIIALQDELDQKLSTSASEVLGLDPKRVSFRRSNKGEQYILRVSLARQQVVSEKIVDGTQIIPLTFYLNTSALEEAFGLLQSYKSQLTQLSHQAKL
jgi:hypothetical protein